MTCGSVRSYLKADWLMRGSVFYRTDLFEPYRPADDKLATFPCFFSRVKEKYP